MTCQVWWKETFNLYTNINDIIQLKVGRKKEKKEKKRH